ncbi:MAG: efflux RND transporter periplasmic adaptor subunit [Leptonema sp. (in: bacteria)]
MKSNYKIIILVFVMMLLGIGFFFLRENHKDSIQYKTEKLIRGTIQEKVTATGTINPISNVVIGSSISGMIKKIYVDFNSKVKKGQLLALIDEEPFLAQLEQAKANVIIAEANLEKAKVNVMEAEKNFQRYSKLYEEKLISESEYERYLFLYKAALAQAKDAQGKVAQAKATLRQANTNLNYTRIRSPIDGTVISRNIEIGQTVSASFQSPNLFTIAEDLSKMQINTNVDESDISKIKEGQKTLFTVDAYPDKNFEGKVVQIRNSPIVVQNVVTYDVIVHIENKNQIFKPGMTAQVVILTRRKENVFLVNNSALRVKLPTENSKTPNRNPLFDKPGIYILENQIPKRIEVEIGISDEVYTEISSPNLKENLLVITEFIQNKKQKKSLF